MKTREEAEPVSNIYVISDAGDEVLIGVRYLWNNGEYQDKITHCFEGFEKEEKIYKNLTKKTHGAHLAA